MFEAKKTNINNLSLLKAPKLISNLLALNLKKSSHVNDEFINIICNIKEFANLECLNLSKTKVTD